MAPYDLGGAIFAGTYEQLFQEVSVGDPADASGWAFPALFQIGDSENWVLITEADLTPQYSATRLHEEPNENLYRMMITAMTINYSDLKTYTSTFPLGEIIYPDPGNHKICENH